MKLNANIAGDEHVVHLRRDQDCLWARVDERNYRLQVRETEGAYLIQDEGRVFECRVEGQPRSGQIVDVFVGTNHYAVALTDPKRLRGATGASAHNDGAARIVAPMPGKVVRLLTEAGAHVEAGAGVVVVEAMKMQNEMKSPKTGTVATINVEVGATVNRGDVLAVVE